MRTFTQSTAWLERAQRFIPLCSQTASKAPGRLGPIGAYPLAIESASGCRLRDVDGSSYIDYLCSNAAITLGHQDFAVREAVAAQLKKGVLFSLPSPLEGEVAELICQVVPCAEQVRFVKTGSEACAAAVRIARIVTGRDTILTTETSYHGWHDWFTVTRPQHPGVPEWMAFGIRRFPYNDLAALERQLQDAEAARQPVAAVMLEPTLVEAPHPDFLSGVVDLAHRYGALAIFDEMICGGHWAVGGGQQYFEVVPDLATFGKGLANGFPLAFICGSAEYMQHAWPISGTFGGELLSLAACQVTIFRLIDTFDYRQTPIEHQWIFGRRVMDAFNGTAARLGLPVQMIGQAVHPIIRWGEVTVSANLATSLLQQELAQHGVLCHPAGWFFCAAHDAAALADTQDAMALALASVAGFLSCADPARHLRGPEIEAAFAVRTPA